jgi:hypothetical protein
VNKHSFALLQAIATILGEEAEISFDTKIKDVFSKKFNAITWFKVLVKLELTYGFHIPADWKERIHLTIEEYSHLLSGLKIIPESMYPEFYEIKTRMYVDVIKEAKIVTGMEESSKKQLTEIREKLDFMYKRLKQITELPVN